MAIAERTIAQVAAASGGQLSVGLLDGFRLLLGQSLLAPVSGASQRLFAFLALRNRPLSRTLVAETLWPDTSDARAHASLRSALARLPEPARAAISTTFSGIALADGVEVDLYRDRPPPPPPGCAARTGRPGRGSDCQPLRRPPP